MGGVPIVIGAAFSILLWMNNNLGYQNKYLLSTLVIFFVIGLRDDLIPMKPSLKLVSQLIPIVLISVFSEFQIVSFYNVWPIDFPQAIAIPITIFTLIVITNSFNLIDGLDGLAGSVGLIILSSLGFWFFQVGEYSTAFISFSFVGGIIAFLIYNWSPSRIFMGDTGALTIGFLIACLIIHFINSNYNLTSENPFRFQNTISTAICLLIVPLTDTLRVFILRVRNAKSPFSADNNHIHHELIALGLSHSSATLILALVNVLFIGVAISCRNISDAYTLVLILFLASLLLLILKYFSSRKSQSQERPIK